MGLRQRLQFIIDSWSPFDYKPIYSHVAGMPHRRAFPEAAATWVPAADERRLASYKLLAAYDNNQAGELASLRDGESALDRREFGDPAMFIDALVAHVLGREQHIVVPGAEADSPDGQPDADADHAQQVQERLRQWAEDELLPMRMQQCERKAVSLGSGVYRITWDPTKRRPILRVTDPGFYFPVLGEDDDGGEYPRKVHFAWELPEDTRRGLKQRLRRVTYELDWIRPATESGMDDQGRPVRAFGTPLPGEEGEEEDTGVLPLVPGDTVDPGTGQIVRQYAWNDDPSPFTCYLTDATWLMEDLRGPDDVDSLPMDRAVFAVREDGQVLDHLDLMIDFVPVVHVPNTVPSAEEHWGQSSLAKIMQVMDELQGADTDSARASATTGAPIIGISGNRESGDLAVRPGMVLTLGDDGRMDTLNTAPQLAELRNHRHDLMDRASTVARLPAVAIGTLDPTKVPSGYALQLSLGPLDSLIASMRLARDHKYALLAKFVARLFVAGQHPDWVAADILPAKVVFGPYTPTDRTAILADVALGVTQGVLSLETGLRMLTEAGFPIEDAALEIERIQSRQFEQARLLADATGDQDAVGDFLGIDLKPPPPPPPVLPPNPGNPGGDPNQPPGGNQPQGGGNPEE